MSNRGDHALVFGASGLQGWAVVNQLLSCYPKPGTFSHVTALTNRPLERSKAFWPEPAEGLPSLTLASGVNLSEGTAEDLATSLKDKVPNIDTVTNVFFFAHKASSIDLADEANINVEMVERTIKAVTSLTSSLKFVVYPGGAMAYGIYNPGGYFKAPLREDVERLPGDKGAIIPYYGIRDTLARLSTGQSWNWAELMMDAIVGFAPNGSGWSLAGHWATYLSCYRLVEGEGAVVPYPGTEKAYRAKFNESGADTIAKQAIWASLNPEKTHGQIWNVADRTEPSTMAERWPVIASAFGLTGVGPVEDSEKQMKPGEYIRSHGHVLQERGFKSELVHLPGHLDGYGFHMDFDRHFDLSKTRVAGFVEERDPSESWLNAFSMFRKASLIP